MNRSVRICCWNVRGLGDSKKCDDVLSEILSSNADIVLLQETKLSDIPPSNSIASSPVALTSSSTTRPMAHPAASSRRGCPQLFPKLMLPPPPTLSLSPCSPPRLVSLFVSPMFTPPLLLSLGLHFWMSSCPLLPLLTALGSCAGILT